jgi:hypothetical protein
MLKDLTLPEVVALLLQVQEEKRLTLTSRAEGYTSALDDVTRELGKLAVFLAKSAHPPEEK